MKQLFLLGSGMYSYRQITLETLEVLKGADVVFSLAMPDVHMFLEQIAKRAVDLLPTYRTGELNLNVYDEIVETVMEATREHERVVYMVLGHPRLFDRSVLTLSERAPQENVEVVMHPAVSAFDAMLLELSGVDIGLTGLQMYEANHLLVHEYPVNTRVPLLLWQLGVFGTRILTRGKESKPERIQPLVDYLLRHYLGHHQVLALECKIAPEHRNFTQWVLLKDLAALAAHFTYNHTLFVPAVGKPPVVNAAFEAALHDTAHAATLTR
jgi:precorrin-6B methylase 1